MIQSTTLKQGGIYLFGRSYALSIGKSLKQPGALQYANFAINGPDGKPVPASPIRVAFELEKNNLGTMNKAKFEVYNLSQQARNSIEQGNVVQFQAGYKGLVQTLFVGNIHPKGIKSERKGADIVLTFEAGDGESAITSSILHNAYPPGTTLAQILGDIGKAMNLTTASNPDGVSAGVSVGIPNVVYGKGISVDGACKDTLNKLLTPLNLSWSIQNLALTIVPRDAYNGSTAIVVSKETGMIGVPSKNPYLTFTSLLNPNLVPNALVQIISDNKSLRGYYKINKGKYEGDTHDNKWQVQCECVAMPGVTQKLPTATNFDYFSAVVT